VSPENQVVADLALFSFVKVLAKINKLTHILEYRQHTALNTRMPGYQVKMGFGLHQGWAIEGAIGSFFKIDASYLSPNVNMASRLEYATKQYGVSILVSGPFATLLSAPIKKYLREIDNVTVKGSVLPITLNTVDVDFNGLEEIADRFQNMMVKEKKSIRDQEKKQLLTKVERGWKTTLQVWSQDAEFKELRRNYDPMFVKKFNEAYLKYREGDWATAEDIFSQCLKINPSDGPTKNLKLYIERCNGRAPQGWVGVRELTDK